MITEVEAYHQSEPAAHSYGGHPTKRTQALFGPAGTAYVYLSYGVHLCMNLVTGPEGRGEALLLRSAIPVFGLETINSRRGRDRDLLTGPGRLAQGLAIRMSDNGSLLIQKSITSFEEAIDASYDGPIILWDGALAASAKIMLPLDHSQILVGPRVGITKAVELPWRFAVKGVAISRPFPAQANG